VKTRLVAQSEQELLESKKAEPGAKNVLREAAIEPKIALKPEIEFEMELKPEIQPEMELKPEIQPEMELQPEIELAPLEARMML